MISRGKKMNFSRFSESFLSLELSNVDETLMALRLKTSRDIADITPSYDILT